VPFLKILFIVNISSGAGAFGAGTGTGAYGAGTGWNWNHCLRGWDRSQSRLSLRSSHIHKYWTMCIFILIKVAFPSDFLQIFKIPIY
jgi:hypothetical protein